MDRGHRFNFELTTMAAHHRGPNKNQGARASILLLLLLLLPRASLVSFCALRGHAHSLEFALSHDALDCAASARTTVEQYWNSSLTRPVRSFTVSRVCFAVATHATTLFRCVTVHRYATFTNVCLGYLLKQRLPFVYIPGTIFRVRSTITG